jgi:hypothetical protein
MKSTFTTVAAAIVTLSLLHTTQAEYKFKPTDPEDLVGILADDIVPTEELCQSLCDENELCLATLYHRKCDECWQLDCSAGDRIWDSATDYKKPLVGHFYYCEEEMLPEMPKDCSNLTATATITSLGQPAETGGGDKNAAVFGARFSWLELGIGLAAAGAFLA